MGKKRHKKARRVRAPRRAMAVDLTPSVVRALCVFRAGVRLFDALLLDDAMPQAERIWSLREVVQGVEQAASSLCSAFLVDYPCDETNKE